MNDSAIYPDGCPIDVEAKRWLEQRFEWLVEKVGPALFGQWPGTDLRMPRYMTCAMASYALALASIVRGDRENAWLQHLGQDASTNAKASLRYLRSTDDVPPSLVAAIERAPKRTQRNDVDGTVVVIDKRNAVQPKSGLRHEKRRAKGRIRMKGRWRGSYGYDSPAQVAKLGSFTMNLHDGWFGNFRGTCHDDFPGPDEESEVEGSIHKSQVTWTKSYPHYWVADAGGAIRYEEYLRVQEQIEVDGKIDGFDVVYDGEYDEERQLFEGTWRIVHFERTFSAGGILYGLPEVPGTTGRWTMRRVDDR